jgi:hypothetical protein
LVKYAELHLPNFSLKVTLEVIRDTLYSWLTLASKEIFEQLLTFRFHDAIRHQGRWMIQGFFL